MHNVCMCHTRSPRSCACKPRGSASSACPGLAAGTKSWLWLVAGVAMSPASCYAMPPSIGQACRPVVCLLTLGVPVSPARPSAAQPTGVLLARVLLPLCLPASLVLC